MAARLHAAGSMSLRERSAACSGESGDDPDERIAPTGVRLSRGGARRSTMVWRDREPDPMTDNAASAVLEAFEAAHEG
jgi:hypothetical protein